MQKIKNSLTIGAIVLTGLFVHSYNLSSSPSGIYVDEAVTGINAYSILMTGRDEYGKSLPILFRFFGSYSPPLYVYLTTIPVFFLGLTEVSVRIVSVIFSGLMIILLYNFLKSSELVSRRIYSLILILFIITPWNFFYSRTGYEIYLGFFLYSLGLLLTWIGLIQKKYLILGFLVLSLSIYGSHVQMYSVPLFVIFFFGVFYKLINLKYFLLGLLVAAIIQIPRLGLYNTNAFLNKSDLFYFSEIVNNAGKLHLPEVISLPVSFLFSFFARLINYFSPNSLFFMSDPDPQRSVPEISVFYNWMVIPYALGFYIIFLNLKNKFIRFLLIMIGASIIPPSLTRDPFSSQRALPLLLPFFLIISFGISLIFEKIRARNFLLVSVTILILSAIIFWRSYFVLLPSERAIAWNYGYKELASIIKKNPNAKFIVEQGMGKPGYVELAFFLKTPPAVLQSAVDQGIKSDYYNLGKFNANINFENIEMRNIVWEKDIYHVQILVADEIAISKNQASEHFLTEIFRIKDPRGYPIFIGYKTDPERKCTITDNLSILCNRFN